MDFLCRKVSQMRKKKRLHKIYMYTCKFNGKVYIGRTCRKLHQRAGYKGKNYNHCTYFWNAIQKYGWENFEPTILEEGLDAKEASNREIFWIKEYDATNRNKGYNIRDKVCSDFTEASCKRSKNYINPMKGKKHSEEAKRKMREHHANFKGENSPIYGRKFPGRGKGRVLSEETRRKIGVSNKGKCKGKVPWNKGIPMDEETKDKLRQLNIGEKNPFFGRKHSEESLKKMKESKMNISEETRKKMSEGSTKYRVLCIETGIIYKNSKEASIKTGVHKDSISRCCSGNRKTAGGYRWKYLEKLDNPLNS